MTDVGQAQNSLKWGGGGGETRVLTSLDFTEYRFCNDKTLSDPPSAWYAF